ncbi:DPP IV N-terminal domain-containing protein [Thermomonas sp.]|uniref:S9 family peptidase n=1 Tax=Thermomonas sp. TaxID=1971895 RepID=UPI002CFC0FD7|nr:DPP IV N-terminal domain-containing protein [Thermomonas sp.]HRO63357.1 DPP IV N-terminal domain-containing protein [Thermomonas sp.]
MTGAGAAMGQTVTTADYQRAASMLADRTMPLIDHAISQPSWLDDGSLVYREQADGKTRVLRFDPATGKSAPAFDPQALADAMNLAAGGKGRPVNKDRLPPLAIQRNADGSLLLTSMAGGGFRCDTSGCTAVPKPAVSGDEPGVASPDGSREAFVRDWNLWLRDVASGKETQLTFDGKPDYGYATDNAGWKHTGDAVLVWSPDGSKIASFRQDQRKTSLMTLVGTNVGAPKVEQWRYPFAGDKDITLIERVIIDLSAATPRLIRLQMSPDQHRSTCADDLVCGNGWEDVQWARDGKTLAFVSTDRGHKSATLRVADAATGTVRDVFTETVATQYQSAPALDSVNWRYLPESNEFLWFSQKSDWGHLYLYDLTTGKLKRQLTSGSWNVAKIVRLDAKARSLWFTGVGREAGRDPYFVHYYRVGLDGGDVQLLTPEDANHSITASADGKYFLDTYSTIATAPVAVVRDADGKQVAELARADLTRLRAAGWVPPEAFTVKARDGKTDLYGQMFKPSNFDPAKKYPIITYIYPGPQVGSVRSRSFLPAQGDNQALAELGFVVIALDGMGTPMRSKTFQDVSYGNMADNTLPDQVAALKQLGERYPWIDTSRAGIWGHSGGGNATAAAMFRYPDVYKVGIAESGNHENLSYEDDWGERFQGLLERKPDGTSNYTGQDNAPLASHLQGKLLLIHGMMDDNVPPQSTLLVVDALVKANKDFDLLLLPHARHGYGMDSYYVMRRRWDYFVRNLLGATPPKEFELKMQF